jgi:hypothetical protein
MRKLTVLLVFIACPFLLRAQPLLYMTSGAGNSSSLYTVDPTNLNANLIGQVKVNGSSVTITGLAFHPITGVLYGVTGNEYSPARQLVTIDLNTAVGTSIGTIGAASNQIANDITFAADGTLYGWTAGGGPLVTLNTTNAARTVIGSAVNGSASNGLTFAPNGTLYLGGPNAPGNLYTVNPTTGAITSAATFSNAPVDFGTINAMASDETGMLYATSKFGGRFVKIDPLTGIMTDLGLLSFGDSDALAFQLNAVPEPSSYGLLLGAVGLGLVMLRRRK